MEVTTMSTSPASPTEGDDLCETNVTDVAIHSVTLLICLCGLAGNGAVLWLLSLKIHNSIILDLAVADSLFLLFMVSSALLFLVEDMSCRPIMPLTYVGFLFQLSVVSYYWGLYRLTLSSNVIDRLCNVIQVVLFNLCCSRNLPERLRWVVDSVQDWAIFSLFTIIPAMIFLCLSHEQEHCRAALISMYAITLLLFATPLVIFSTIDIIKGKRGSQQQQPKRRDTVIFIVVLLTFLLGLCNLLQQLGYIPVFSEAFFLLTCIHSSSKPFIYFLAGKCWSPCSKGSLQLSLLRVFEGKKEKTAHRNDAFMDTGV